MYVIYRVGRESVYLSIQSADGRGRSAAAAAAAAASSIIYTANKIKTQAEPPQVSVLHTRLTEYPRHA